MSRHFLGVSVICGIGIIENERLEFPASLGYIAGDIN